VSAVLASVGTDALDYSGEHSCPDLQQLVESSGGYDEITPEAWARFDAGIASYHEHRRIIASADCVEPAQENPRREYSSFEECAACFARGVFGYLKKTLAQIGQLTPAAAAEPGDMIWFCRRHMPAQHFADARR
jgi:hypothetical protein